MQATISPESRHWNTDPFAPKLTLSVATKGPAGCRRAFRGREIAELYLRAASSRRPKMSDRLKR